MKIIKRSGSEVTFDREKLPPLWPRPTMPPTQPVN